MLGGLAGYAVTLLLTSPPPDRCSATPSDEAAWAVLVLGLLASPPEPKSATGASAREALSAAMVAGQRLSS